MNNPAAILLTVIALLHSFNGTLAAQDAQDDWVQVWSDEFDGDSLDLNKWEHEVNAWGGGNNELQFYTDRETNVRLENGMLVIQAHAERFTGVDQRDGETRTRDYTSGRIRTKNKGDWRYGRFEARIKMPIGQGIWPAFWMMPTDSVYGGWAASGEIDIMEYLGHEPERVHGTLHYGGQWPRNSHSGEPFELDEGSFAEEFHTFAIEWEEGEIRWYVDGEHVQTQTQWHSENGEYPAPFDKRFHLILNLAVGGNWPGAPDESTVFPQSLLVDYVRVYQRANGVNSSNAHE